MVTVNEPPASVEGSALLITGLDIKPEGRPTYFNGEMVFQLSVKRRGDATIVKEAAPKKALFRDYSLLNAGDKISGRNLWGFSSNPIMRDDIVVGGQGKSSSHSGQELNITGFCFAELIEGWRGAPLKVHPKQDLTGDSKHHYLS